MTFEPCTSRLIRRLAVTLAPAVFLCTFGTAHAQPTTTELGTYTLCRTAAAGASGQACHELSLTTAPRLGVNGQRTGTTGTLTLRNLQGTTFTADDGRTFATGTGPSVLTGVTFYSQGCLPGQPCASPDFFDGLPFGRNESGASTPAADGPVAGSVPAWRWNADKPLAGDNPNTLRFEANTRFVNNFSNVQILGIGGCTAGGGQLAGQFRDVVQAVRTCDPQSFSGAAQFSFATGFVFDPTYFQSLRVDWAQPAAPGAAFASHFCAASASRRGEVFSAFSGCQAFAAISAVPEPATWLMFGLGAAMLGGLARRREG